MKSLTASINKKTQRLEKWNASNFSVQVREAKHNTALKIQRENDFQHYVYWYVYIDYRCVCIYIGYIYISTFKHIHLRI